MYKIMVVDDEDIIREGLISSIDWLKHGYKIVAEAENGKKALDVAKEVKPDIILTDIYMPLMDGISFAKEIKKIFPEIILIFLTGYNEFTYAQRAIEIGVFRYLTKPIVEEELLVVLQEAAKDLNYKELEKTQISKLKSLIRESFPLLKERFFLNLVKGAFTEKEIQSKMEYLNIHLDASGYYCLIISLDEFFNINENMNEADINLLKFAIQNMAEEILLEVNGAVFAFEEKRNEIGVICCIKDVSEADLLCMLHPVLQKIQDSVRRYMKTTITIGIGSICHILKETDRSYREAEAALEYKTAFGKNSIIYTGDIEKSDKGIASNTCFEKVNELVKAIKGGSIELSYEVLAEIFEQLKQENKLKKDHIHLLVIEIVNKFIRVVLEYGADISEVYGEGFTPFVMMQYDTLEDISQSLKELVGKTIEFINSKHKAVNRNFIEKAKDFINKNYMQEGLSLSTIADCVHVSPGYLSQLFKQVVGESCVEYLSKVRINQAKKLLKETNLKAYEVAFQIGFNDSQYFSTCFKKYVGVSPTDYRDIIANDILD